MMRLKDLLRPLYAPVLRPFLWRRDHQRERMRIRGEVQRAISESRPVKTVIGAGQTRYPGWIATDMPAFDVLRAGDWARIFPPRSIDNLLAEHVFEHLTTADFARFLKLASQYLAPGGRIRIAVPDGNHPDSDYIAQVKPGGTGPGAADHKVLYTCGTFGDLLREQGFQHVLLEYYDDAGRFHHTDWSADDGFIGRSASHDPRNQDGRLKYTSLIVDCWL